MIRKINQINRRILAMLMAMAMLAAYLPAPVFAVGTTNADGYIEVRTVEDLYAIHNNLGGKYILMNDIDLSAATASDGKWSFEGQGWMPIGGGTTYTGGAFSGIFDGNGHTISGMRINVTTVNGGNSYAYIGLFAYVTGTVKNLNMTGGSVYYYNSVNAYIGSIAGYVGTNGKIENCHNSTELTGAMYCDSGTQAIYVGGITGYLCGAISTCSNAASVTSKFYDYYTSSTLDADKYYAGGIAGYSYNGATITKCYNTGIILAKAGYYSGYYYGSSYSYYGYPYSAGISYGPDGKNTYCYNTGNITASHDGFDSANKYAYAIGGKATNCYNVGTITSSSTTNEFSDTATQCYFLSGTGCTSSATLTSLSEQQMKMDTMYKGFDLESIWILNPYATYPYPQLRSNIQNLVESASVVSIISLPNKLEYIQGEALDFTGAMAKVIYVSGKEELLEITPDMVSGYVPNTLGAQQVTVTIAGGSDTFTVTVVKAPVVTDLSLVLEPDTKVFTVGTAFDFTGAKVKVVYDNGKTEYLDIAAENTTGGNINHIGKQTITYTLGGKSVTFNVEVVGVAMDRIVLTQKPDKLSYIEGQELDLSGMVITAVMTNGAESTLGDNYTVSGYSALPGIHTVTVTYFGMTVSFQVTVVEKQLLSFELKTLPTKLEYIVGQEFDGTGMELVATYDNGMVINPTNYTVSGLNDVPGIKNVTISFEGQSVTFPAKVVARVITDFKLLSVPTKLDYIENESFDTTGLKAVATYNDGTTETVTDYNIAGFSSNPGTHTISVAYQGYVQSFQINVLPKVLDDVQVTVPNKVTYFIGEEFDPTGMEVLAFYSNGQTVAVNDYKISGFDSNAPGAKTISITYGSFTRSFVVAVQERSAIVANGSFIVDDLIGRLGEEVRIPVTITNNTGIAGICHQITFQVANLKFVGVEMMGQFANGTVIVNDENADEGSATIVWFTGMDIQETGVMYELIFQIQETATDGITAVELNFADNDNGNISGENVIFGKQDGSVDIRSYWLGDLNGDRKCAMVDLVMLAQYIAGFDMTLTAKQLLSADVNEDGSIDIHDIILLNQWVLAADF